MSEGVPSFSGRQSFLSSPIRRKKEKTTFEAPRRPSYPAGSCAISAQFEAGHRPEELSR